ncbi:hypothetical protein [Streptomyces vinaceus]|uniref:hypothetical protein n=1 Tax=Streptomyces vinaceus TaxID=1960 RepID=UPI0036BA7508
MNKRHLISTVTVAAATAITLGFSPTAFAKASGSSAAGVAAVVEHATGTSGLAPLTPTTGGALMATSRTTGGAVTVMAPSTTTGDVTSSAPDGSTLSVTLPATRSVAAQDAGRGTAVYPGAAKDTDLAVQSTADGGARVLVALNSANAPTEHRFTFKLPAGAELVANEEHGYDVVKKGATGGMFTLGQIQAPWAKDARGNDLPTSYRLEGDTVVQDVATDNGTAYPVVADPKFTWGIATGTAYFNKKETKEFATAAGVVSWATRFAPPPWGTIISGYATYIAAQAGIASANDECVEVKSVGVVYRYSGGYCS